jgi:hypothetical protein
MSIKPEKLSEAQLGLQRFRRLTEQHRLLTTSARLRFTFSNYSHEIADDLYSDDCEVVRSELIDAVSLSLVRLRRDLKALGVDVSDLKVPSDPVAVED